MPTKLVNPLDERASVRAIPAPRLSAIDNKRIALLDISKPGGSIFLDRVSQLLKDRQAGEILRFTKPTFTKPAPDEIVDAVIAARVDAVIEALAD